MNIAKYVTKIRNHKWEFILFAAILAVGIFLRAYNFSDWLHFEIDQTYDFNIVSRAIENGPGNLPLLGPTAGGGRALRLGPAFYYLEYASAMIFGNSPTGHAMLVLLFSILSIPIFYLLCKRYFKIGTSLAITLIFTVSFYNVLYSRFSWSPNVLPFLIIVSFLALLKSVDENNSKKDNWFLLSILSAAIVTQIHFNAFFTIPPIIIAFLLIKRPRFTLKTWLFSVLIVLTAYSPMIASDIKTGGENLTFFEKKLFKAKGSATKFKSSIAGDLQHNVLAYFFIVTGQGQISSRNLPEFTILNLQQPTKHFLLNLTALIFFLLGLALLIKNLLKEKDIQKKDFLTLTLLWFSFSILYFFSIVNSYRMYPRFFLLVSPIAIIFLGLILSLISEIKFLKNPKINLPLIAAVALLLSLGNISKISDSFHGYNNSSKQAIPNLETEDIFPNTARITLIQQQEIAEYIHSIAIKNGFPVYISTMDEYKPAFWYHLEKLGINYYDELRNFPLYKEANYFYILQADKPSRASQNFIFNEKKKFGSLIVYYYSPNEALATTQRQNESDKKQTDETKNILELPTWNKL